MPLTILPDFGAQNNYPGCEKMALPINQVYDRYKQSVVSAFSATVKPAKVEAKKIRAGCPGLEVGLHYLAKIPGPFSVHYLSYIHFEKQGSSEYHRNLTRNPVLLVL